MRIAALGSALAANVVLAPAMAAQSPVLMTCEGCRITPNAPRRAASIPRIAADELFRSSRFIGRGVTDQFAAHLLGSGQNGFNIETERRVARRTIGIDRIGLPRDKLSSGSVTMRYGIVAGEGDRLSLGLSAAMEKRRFAFDLAQGHMSRAKSVGVEATWLHGPSWRLAGGYRIDQGIANLSQTVRAIELAEGATRSQRGPWAALSYRLGDPDSHRDISFGVKMQAMRLTEEDRIALGVAGAQDARITFTTSIRFR